MCRRPEPERGGPLSLVHVAPASERPGGSDLHDWAVSAVERNQGQSHDERISLLLGYHMCGFPEPWPGMGCITNRAGGPPRGTPGPASLDALPRALKKSLASSLANSQVQKCVISSEMDLKTDGCLNIPAVGAPGGLSGRSSAFGSGRDPGVPGSSPTSGSLHGACFSLCLCLCLSLCVSQE